MVLTPLDVENTRFRGALGGYNRGEVDQFMHRTAQSLEELLGTIANLRERIGQLEAEVAKNRENEDVLRNSLVLAQRTCDELIAAAHKEADLIKREAHAEGHEYKLQLAEVRSQREQFEYAFHGLLSGFLHRLEQGNPALSDSRRGQRELPATPPKQSRDESVAFNRDVLAPDTPTEPEHEQPEDATSVGKRQLWDFQEPTFTVPTMQSPSTSVSAAPPLSGAEVDRDADITDFSKVLDAAADKEPQPWPGLKDVLEEIPVGATPPEQALEVAPEPVEASDQVEPGITPEPSADEESEQRKSIWD